MNPGQTTSGLPHLHIGHHFWGAGNIGDDWMLAGFLRAVQLRGREFRITCCIPHDSGPMRLRFPEVEWFGMDIGVREMLVSTADAWVGLGDTPFQSDCGTWLLDHIEADLEICRRFQTPVYFLAAGVESPAACRLPQTRRILSQTRRLWARDRLSASLLAETAGSSARITPAADLAHIYFDSLPPQCSSVSPGALGLVINVERTEQLDLEQLSKFILQHPTPPVRWIAQEVRNLQVSEVCLWEKFAPEVKPCLVPAVPDYQKAALELFLEPYHGLQAVLSTRYHSALATAWRGAAISVYARSQKLDGLVDQLGCATCESLATAEKIAEGLARAKPVAPSVLRAAAQSAQAACDEFFQEIAGLQSARKTSGPASGNSSSAAQIKRILWVRTDSIGDAVLASSMLQPIRQKHPQARLAVLCQRHLAELFTACPVVDSIICYERNKVESDAAERAQLISEIAAFQPDLILNSVRSRDKFSDELTLAFTKARHAAIECDLDNISETDRTSALAQYDLLVPTVGVHKPELERHADFLRGLDIGANDLRPAVWTTAEDENLAGAFFQQEKLDGQKTIALFPFTQHAIKDYPHFAEALAEIGGWNFLIFGGVETGERCAALAKSLRGNIFNLAGKTSLREMAALIRRCRIFVGSDSSGAHISCAVGTPNVVVLGGGHFGRFLPHSPLTSTVSLPLDCFGCKWQCKFSFSHCIQNLSPKVLSEAVSATLKTSGDKPRMFVQANSSDLTKLQRGLANLVTPDAVEIVPVTVTQPSTRALPSLEFGRGVHKEEPGFRWLDAEAELRVSVPPEGLPCIMTFELQAGDMVNYTGESLHVEVHANDKLERGLRFSADRQCASVELCFQPATQPYSVCVKSNGSFFGEGDDRRLAVRLQKLSLTPKHFDLMSNSCPDQKNPKAPTKSSAMKLPKITIITPSYNQGEFLEDTIRSVLDQKYPNLEFFVVDGGSKDSSVEIIKRYAKHFDWWVSEKDRGQSHAINKGLERATGDIVTWLNSDDFFYPGALDYVAQAWQAHPEAGLFVGNGTLADRQGRRVRRYSKTLAWDYDILLRGANYVLQPATFLARRVFQEQGFIDEKITYGMDLELWLRVGNKYPVVTIDEELAAFRWYDEVKSVAGGFKEWIAMYEMTRRYCKDPITPGLILEFFKKLQDPKVQAAAGFQDFAKFAQGYYWKFYNELQSLMRTADCIPLVNKGIPFVPDKTRRAGHPVSAQPATSAAPGAPAATSARKQIVDVVLPAGHSWFVREGYVEALKVSGNLGRVFYVPSWKNDELQTRELFEYLKHPQSDAIFLMDTLWHAQQVHATSEWRQRWAQCPARKILFSFECMNNPVIRANPEWWRDNLQAVERAAQCADAVVYAHEMDGELFRRHGLAALWQPFAVDPAIFPPLKNFDERKPRGFFKGKAEKFYSAENCYRERRELIAYLRQHAPNVDLVDQYASSGGVLERNQKFIREMGEYQIIVGLPSLSPTMVVRPFEAMLSGCVFLQNRVEGERTNQLFRDGEHLVFYDAAKPEELVEKINELIANPARAKRIAEHGKREVLARHTIRHRMAEVLAWLEANPVHTSDSAGPTEKLPVKSNRNKIVIDGVIFDMQRGRQHGISRVWHRLLEQLAQTPLAPDIVLLDRDGTAPTIPGIRKRAVAAYDYQRFEADSLWLQRWCDEENAGLFISTYYTWAETTPSVIMLHDMIPELTGQDLQHPEWRAKSKAIQKAIGYFAVSQSTVDDFHRLYPELAGRKLFLTPNAVGDEFKPAGAEAVRAFREKHRLRKPYFLLVGNRTLYKNAILFFKAFARLSNRKQFEIVCAGGSEKLEAEFAPCVKDLACHVLRLSNEELSAAYSGAVALVYPSRHEGFGLPVLEAQKCGCPVVTCRNSSLPEVAGESAIFTSETDEAAMQQALIDVQQPALRQALMGGGTKNVQRFSWEKTGRVLADAVQQFRSQAVGLPGKVRDPINTIRRLIFVADELGDAGRNLSRYLRTITWQYEGFEYYNHQDIGAAEAAVAVGLNQLGPRFLQQFAPLHELDNLTALALGLAAEARKDWRQAWVCYAQALHRAAKGIYGYRLGLRLARAAASGGDTAASESVMQQLSALRGSLPANLDAAAEEAAVRRWQAVLPDCETSQRKKPTRDNARNSTPLVTAIVSTFKSERFLRGCLEDLEAQTIADQLEIIVVDSHSPQNERAIVEEFQKKYSNIIYIRTRERETVYGAWNRGARAAKGKYLTNANTDDRHRPDALEILVRTLDKNPEVVLAYADCLVTSHENETYHTANPISCYHWLDFDARALWEQGCFCGPQPMWRREVHDEHGYFDAQMVSAGDYEFWLRLAQNRKFLHVRQTLGLYLKSPTSVEHANQEIGAKEVKMARDRYRDSILNGKRAFRPKLPEPTAAVEVVVDGLVKPEPKKAPMELPPVANIGQLDNARQLFGRKNYSAAWTSALAAVSARPFHPEGFLLLAEIALAAGDGQTAKVCAQHACELAPDWKEAKQFLKKAESGKRKTENNPKPDWLNPSSILNPPSSPRLSVCLIVKNEEQFLAQCLKSIEGLAQQIVVVDTGSTDRTVEIAKSFGAEVHSFAWCDDFSAARNAALEHATGDWILMLDADEELPAAEHERLRADMKRGDVIAFRLPLVNKGEEAQGKHCVPRLFRNAPGVHYYSRVHEQVFPSLIQFGRAFGLKTAIGTAEITHYGYAKEIIRDRKKNERNLKLLRQAVQEYPHDANLQMNLGLELIHADDVPAALVHYREAFRLMSAQPAADVAPELREVLLTQFTCHLYKVRAHDEIVQVLNSPLAKQGALSASLHFALGLALFELKKYAEAAEEMRQCLAKRKQPSLAPINTDILTAVPQHCLALSLAKSGDAAGAEKAFIAALKETGATAELMLDYAKFLAAQNRPVEALQQVNELVAANSKNASAWRFGGEVALAKPEFLEFARDWTTEAIRQLPDDGVIIAQRAEALLLSQQPTEALPLWTRAINGQRPPRALAARIICATAASQPTAALHDGAEESAVSRAFVDWYGRLLTAGARDTIVVLNSRLETLRPLLPSAARMLEAALSEATAIKS